MAAESVSLLVQYQREILPAVLIVLGLLFFASLVRAVKGPRVADRLVAVNMIGTMVMVMIAILSVYLQEEYLLDICLIYAMASFLAVIVLAKVYIGIYEEQHPEKDGEENKAAPGQGGRESELRTLRMEKSGAGEESKGLQESIQEGKTI